MSKGGGAGGCGKKSSSRKDNDIRTVFELIDEDGSGLIDAKELRRALFLFGNNYTEDDVKAMIQNLTDNDKGQINFKQFKELTKQQLKDEEEEEQEMMDAFKVFDKDGNGYIERRELAEILQAGGANISKQEINCYFDQMDVNQDGKIDYKEFTRAMCEGLF